MRVLISGGAGFIGAALVRALLRDGLACSIVDDLSAGTGERLSRLTPGSSEGATSGRAPRSAELAGVYKLDVTRPGNWRRVLDAVGPVDAVVHLAARVGVRRVLADPDGCRRSNVQGVRELVAALAELPAGERPRVFAASTSEVYADDEGPLGEDARLRSGSGAGRWAYAGSKRAAEAVLDGARGLWSPERGPVHLRFFNVVGPGQDARAGMVMPTFVEHALRCEPLPVHGSGGQLRTFGHVDDVAGALATMVQRRDFPAGSLNLGGFARTTVLELARAVIARAPRGGSLRFVDPRQRVGAAFEEVARREPDLARARGLGVPLGSRTLVELVDDCLARHEQLALTAMDGRPPTEADLCRPPSDSPAVVSPAPNRGIACGSLGS